MRLYRFISLFALILILAACGSTGNTQGSTPTPASTPTPTPVPPTPTPSVFKVGQTAKVGDMEITVNSAKASLGTGGTIPVTTDPDKKFIIISVTLHNTGTKAQNVSSAADFKLKQSDGALGTNDSFIASTLGGDPAPDGSVAANDKLKGDLVFTVKKTEKQLTLTYTPDLLDSSQIATWTISV